MSSDITPVIIINHRQPKNTVEAIKSIWQQDDQQRFRPVVVDSSGDDSWIKNAPPKLKTWIAHLPIETNLGFSGSNNYGWKHAQERWSPADVILLNDDTRIGKHAFTIMVKKLHSRKKIAAVVPKIYFYPGKEFHSGYQKSQQGQVIWYAGGVVDWQEIHGFHWGSDEVDRGQFDHLEDTEFATGCCVALKATAISDKIFDDRYFLYLEDLDLSQRLHANRWEIKFEPSAQVWHKNAGSSGSGSELHQYYQTRNRYLFGFRYGNWRNKIFLTKHLLQQYRHGNLIVKMAIKDFILRKYGYQPKLHH